MAKEEARVLRTAIVTGAARGIGRAVAERLVADGLAVSFVDLPAAREELGRVVDSLTHGGVGLARAVVADVTDTAQVDQCVADHVAHLGGLDVMVANAGVAVTAPLVETTDEQLATSMDINVGGVFRCYRAAARQMVGQGRGGRIIGAASVAAHRGGSWQSAYSASKFAVRGMSQSLAQELGEHGITVNVYSPGVVHTPMWTSIDEAFTSRTGATTGTAMQAMLAQIPLGRLESPTDVAGVVSFLASADAAYVTGQSIVVDGGIWFS